MDLEMGFDTILVRPTQGGDWAADWVRNFQKSSTEIFQSYPENSKAWTQHANAMFILIMKKTGISSLDTRAILSNSVKF